MYVAFLGKMLISCYTIKVGFRLCGVECRRIIDLRGRFALLVCG